MFNILPESRERAWIDSGELNRLENKYGKQMFAILQERAHDRRIEAKSRKHWKRLLRKAKKVA